VKWSRGQDGRSGPDRAVELVVVFRTRRLRLLSSISAGTLMITMFAVSERSFSIVVIVGMVI
jgi:hypothetical protein